MILFSFASQKFVIVSFILNNRGTRINTCILVLIGGNSMTLLAVASQTWPSAKNPEATTLTTVAWVMLSLNVYVCDPAAVVSGSGVTAT